jgi:hypothetical protein
MLLTNQILIGHAGVSPLSDTVDSNVDSRTLQRLQKKKLRKLCKLLEKGQKNLDPEARTLVFLQVQQIQGLPYPVSSDYMSSNSLNCHSLTESDGGSGGLIGSHFGGGGLLGPLLGGGLLGPILGGGTGGLLGNPHSDPNPETLADLVVHPNRYLRPLYRTLRPLVRFFKK